MGDPLYRWMVFGRENPILLKWMITRGTPMTCRKPPLDIMGYSKLPSGTSTWLWKIQSLSSVKQLFLWAISQSYVVK